MRIGRLFIKGTSEPLVLLATFRLLAFAQMLGFVALMLGSVAFVLGAAALVLGFAVPANAAKRAPESPANDSVRRASKDARGAASAVGRPAKNAANRAMQTKAKAKPGLYIDRKGRKLYTIDATGAVTAQYPIGIGKGSIRRTKRSMSDNITPIGDFKVELILSKNADFNAIDSSFQKKYRTTPTFLSLVNSKSGLEQLFKNMNSIDFNADGKPDNAYGAAYIGLTSRTAITGPNTARTAITGPKLRKYGNVAYWYSIAIHGTPNPEKAIGQATSGGCVHLGEDALMKLIGEKFVKIGTRVTIKDAPPS